MAACSAQGPLGSGFRHSSEGLAQHMFRARKETTGRNFGEVSKKWRTS